MTGTAQIHGGLGGGRQVTAAPSSPYAIELKGISKSFGPVQANRDINIAVARGPLHRHNGEKGAGAYTQKSSLYLF
jgi:simple sugar transport system ATP-binding protein